MNRLWSSVAWLVLGVAVPCSASELAPFRFCKDVERSPAEEEEILAVKLDSEIYAATQDRFADLRVVDGKGIEIPYRVKEATETRTETVRQTRSGRVVALKERDDNSVEIVVRLKDDAPPADGMVFRIPLRDFERRVQVFGSDDGKQWQELVTDAVIFDYSRYMDVSQNAVRLPKNSNRYLRIVIENVTDEQQSRLTELTRQLHGRRENWRTERTTLKRRPLRIDRIELWHSVTRIRHKQAQKTDYPIVEFRTEEDAKQKQTVVHIRTRREPLVAFMLETSSVNFSRKAVVEVPVQKGVATEWRTVGSGTLMTVSFRDVKRKDLRLTFPEQRYEEYRIVIANQDNLPLEITGVKAEGHVHQTLFFANPQGTYRVYYGSELVEPARYETTALSLALDEGYEPVPARLGREATNRAFGEGAPPAFGRFVNSPLFLGIVMCLAVIVLACLLFWAGRRVEQIPGQ